MIQPTSNNKLRNEEKCSLDRHSYQQPVRPYRIRSNRAWIDSIQIPPNRSEFELFSTRNFDHRPYRLRRHRRLVGAASVVPAAAQAAVQAVRPAVAVPGPERDQPVPESGLGLGLGLPVSAPALTESV